MQLDMFKDVSNSVAVERVAFEHAGYVIYPYTFRDGREAWALQTQDNKNKGTRGFGDTIHTQSEDAKKVAEFNVLNCV